MGKVGYFGGNCFEKCVLALCVCMGRYNHLPVIHEHVRLPQAMRRDPQIANATKLTGIPAKIHIVPFLGKWKNEKMLKQQTSMRNE